MENSFVFLNFDCKGTQITEHTNFTHQKQFAKIFRFTASDQTRCTLRSPKTVHVGRLGAIIEATNEQAQQVVCATVTEVSV